MSTQRRASRIASPLTVGHIERQLWGSQSDYSDESGEDDQGQPSKRKKRRMSKDHKALRKRRAEAESLVEEEEAVATNLFSVDTNVLIKVIPERIIQLAYAAHGQQHTQVVSACSSQVSIVLILSCLQWEMS